VSAEWDFEGYGKFSVKGIVKSVNSTGSSVMLNTTYTFKKAGTYFVTLRGISQRKANDTPFARIQNLERVRVVVK
jgi:PKD repeat protein